MTEKIKNCAKKYIIIGDVFYFNGKPLFYLPYCDEDLKKHLIKLCKK